MRLPQAENAFVDIRKLTDYCLNYDHPRGQHKARVFEATLGITAEHAGQLHEAILNAVLTSEAEASEEDGYGQRFSVDFIMAGPTGEAAIRTLWIVLRNEDFPRLTSCYVI